MEINLKANKDLHIKTDDVLGNKRLILTSKGQYGNEWKIYIDNVDTIKSELIELLQELDND